MSIMSFHRSRLSRATAIVTLAAFLAGCLPQNVKDSAGSVANGTSAITGGAGNLLASLSDMTNSISDITGVSVPGATKDGKMRSWSDEDQMNASEARSVFLGEQLDDLPVYDPLVPGEAQRYKAKLTKLSAKYKGRTTLTSDEMLEISEVVVPLMRFLAKSRAYRASMQKVPKIKRDPKGHASVVVPAGMTMDLALLTYCNDHGLPAPWRGEKLHMRESAYYMPEALRPLYKDLHEYAATHPSAHYLMQSTVWWLRDNPCRPDSLNANQQAMIEAARPGGLKELQSYCMQQKLKGQLVDATKKFIPGGSAAGNLLGQYQQYMATATDYQSKAQAFLNADLSNPKDVLELANSSGLASKLGANTLLRDPNLKKLGPVLQQSGLIKSLIPATVDDKAVATSLSVMEELGRQLGEQQGVDTGSVANYSKLANGLYVEAITNGGASNAFVKVRNTGTMDLEFTGSDFVLTSVSDPNSTHKNYRPTQALSIGPTQPQRVYPNESDAAKRYTPQKEKEAIEALMEAKDLEAVHESGKDENVEKQCEERKGGLLRVGDYKLGILRDVIQAVPFASNAVYAYSALTGKDWMTGETLSYTDRAVAAVSAALPTAGAVRGVVSFGGRVLNGSWKLMRTKQAASGVDGGKSAYHAAAGMKGADGAFSYHGDDMCSFASAGAATAANIMCGRRKTNTLQCVAAQGVASALGNLPLARDDTDEEFIKDFSSRLEYALAPAHDKPPRWKPAIVEDSLSLIKGILQ